MLFNRFIPKTIRAQIICGIIIALLPILLISFLFAGNQRQMAQVAEEQLSVSTKTLSVIWRAQQICDELLRLSVKKQLSKEDKVKFKNSVNLLESFFSKKDFEIELQEEAIILLNQIKTKIVKISEPNYNNLSANLTFLENELDMAIARSVNQMRHESGSFINNLRLFHELQSIEFFIGILMCIVIGLYIASLLIRPFKELQSGISMLAKGEFGIKTKINLTDELGDVQRAFNLLSENLLNTTVSQEYLGRLLNNLSEPILVIDQNLNIIKVNSAAEQLLNKKSVSIIGVSLSSYLVNPEDITKISKNNSHGNFETKLLTNQNEFSAKVNYTLLQSGSDKLQWILTIYDQTDEIAKRAEQLKYLENIKHNERLVALGTLSAEMAHRFNQPLTSLALTLDQCKRELSKHSCDNKVTDKLEICKTEVLRITDSVKNILSYTRRSHTDTQIIVLKDIVEKTASILLDKAKSVDMRIDYVKIPDNLKFNGHLDEIRELFFVLIQNALDAAPKDRASACVINANEKENSLYVTVSDDGKGIEQDKLSHIFEPFFSSKPIGQGTGLGLSIAKKIIADHDGDISVESEYMKGTKFLIRLPL